MAKKKPIPEERPLTEGERRQDEIQGRLLSERRAAEKQTGQKLDLIADGDWIGGT